MGGTIEVCHSCGKVRHGVSEAGCLEELRRKAALWDAHENRNAKPQGMQAMVDWKQTILRLKR